MRRALALAPLLSLLPACIVEAPSSDKSGAVPAGPRAQVKAVPVKNGAVLGEVAELVGATFAPPSMTVGDPTRVVLVFRGIKPTTDDWQVFVHVEDAEGRGERLNADHPLREPTSTWKPGQLVQDEFALILPAGWRSRAVNIFVGMWLPGTNARMKVKNPESVRTDGNDRVLLVQLPVAG
ncbi:MAG TPA: hypothetical protein VFI53_17295 [Myxococcaceae bacterium]|nr:hypothetical protein [Myxococcaceae bacterium]